MANNRGSLRVAAVKVRV